MLTHDGRRPKHDDRRQPLAIEYLSDSGDEGSVVGVCMKNGRSQASNPDRTMQTYLGH